MFLAKCLDAAPFLFQEKWKVAGTTHPLPLCRQTAAASCYKEATQSQKVSQMLQKIYT
jgi:hypothetical protein